jgi:hypothetical protein
MKTNLFRSSVLALVAAAAGYAQGNASFKAIVPFDFIVSGKTLPAGQYSVDQETIRGGVVLSSPDHNGSVVVLGPAIRTHRLQNNARLVFTRYNDLYFLSEVWGAATDQGRKIPKSKLERQLATGQSTDYGNVTVALSK